MKFVLASASPRRRELLKKIVADFETDVARAEERADVSLPPAVYAETLAKQKAEEVASKAEHRGKTVFGADTVVSFCGRILGKPKDKEEARRMLLLLSGKEHSVYTGVCLLQEGKPPMISHGETKVKFKPFTAEFIEEYIASGSPMDKAGAYGIQDGIPVEYVSGSYDNVVGLPTELLKELLLKIAEENGKEK